MTKLKRTNAYRLTHLDITLKEKAGSRLNRRINGYELEWMQADKVEGGSIK